MKPPLIQSKGQISSTCALDAMPNVRCFRLRQECSPRQLGARGRPIKSSSVSSEITQTIRSAVAVKQCDDGTDSVTSGSCTTSVATQESPSGEQRHHHYHRQHQQENNRGLGGSSPAVVVGPLLNPEYATLIQGSVRTICTSFAQMHAEGRVHRQTALEIL